MANIAVDSMPQRQPENPIRKVTYDQSKDEVTATMPASTFEEAKNSMEFRQRAMVEMQKEADRIGAQEQMARSRNPIIGAIQQVSAHLSQQKDMPGFVQGLGQASMAMNPTADSLAAKKLPLYMQLAKMEQEQQDAQGAREDRALSRKQQMAMFSIKDTSGRTQSALRTLHLAARAGGGALSPDTANELMDSLGVPQAERAGLYAAHVAEAGIVIKGKDTELGRNNMAATFKEGLKRDTMVNVAQPLKLQAIRESLDHAFALNTSPTKADFEETLHEHKKAIDEGFAERKETRVLGPKTQSALQQASATNQYIGTVENLLSQPEFAEVQGPLFQFKPSKIPGELGEFKLNPQAVLPKQFQNIDKTVVDSMIAHEIPRLLTLLLNGQSGGASILRQQVGKKLVEDMGITGSVRPDQALEILKIVRDTNNTSIASHMRLKKDANWSAMRDLIGADDPANAYFFRDHRDAFGAPVPNFPDVYHAPAQQAAPAVRAATPGQQPSANIGPNGNPVSWDGSAWVDGVTGHRWDQNGKLVK